MSDCLFQQVLQLNLSYISRYFDELSNADQFLFVCGNSADADLHVCIGSLNVFDSVVTPFLDCLDECVTYLKSSIRKLNFNLSSLHTEHRGVDPIVWQIGNLLWSIVV
jgi:hypothetical protein